MNEKELIHKMKKKKSYAPYLAEYTRNFAGMYYEYASIHLAYSYYTVFEILSEEPEQEWVKPIIEELNRALALNDEEAIAVISPLRDNIMKVMDNITLYTDLLGIYEHILNRVEYRFREVTVPDLQVTLTRIQQFIFADKDAVVTNDKIKTIVSELPLRMTKQRFYDIITDSLAIYKDSDEAGISNFVYQIRTVAGLKDDLKPVEGLADLSTLVAECRNADYTTMSKEEYDTLRERLEQCTETLTFMVNLYMQIQECINHFYTMQLCKPFVSQTGHAAETADTLTEQIRTHFCDDPQSVLDGCNSYLEELEGKQESVMERVMEYEALLHDVLAECPEDAAMQALATCEKLVSSSIFIDLQEETQSVPATPEFIQKTTSDLLEEFAAFFKNHSAILNRAVMSMVLGTVPVFFNSTQEITEYIEYSLEHCSNTAELCASIDIINMIME